MMVRWARLRWAFGRWWDFLRNKQRRGVVQVLRRVPAYQLRTAGFDLRAHIRADLEHARVPTLRRAFAFGGQPVYGERSLPGGDYIFYWRELVTLAGWLDWLKAYFAGQTE